MIILSLFDGIAGARLALKRVGIKVDKYYSSEIDKYAIQVSKNNWNDIIQLGDITKWQDWNIEKPDLIIGGSPCQGFSFAGKQLNFNDPRSKLFFIFVEILKHYKPKHFLLENVKMKKEYQNIISEYLGVKPVEINSSLISAQNRERLYWCNWMVEQPRDKGILLKDIVHEMCDEVIENLYEYIVPFDKILQILKKEVLKGKVGYYRKDNQSNRVYYIHNKAVTLYGEGGGGAAKKGHYLFGCMTPDRINKKQNGQRFNKGRKFYTLTAQDKHGVLIDGYIRKLTSVECERLQTYPDDYTKGISNTQRYKALGNSFTVDVIAYILKELTQNSNKKQKNNVIF